MTERQPTPEQPQDPLQEGRQRVTNAIFKTAAEEAKHQLRAKGVMKPSNRDLSEAAHDVTSSYLTLIQTITRKPHIVIEFDSLKKAGTFLHDALRARPAEVIRNFDQAYPAEGNVAERARGLRLIRSTYASMQEVIQPGQASTDEASENRPVRKDFIDRGVQAILRNSTVTDTPKHRQEIAGNFVAGANFLQDHFEKDARISAVGEHGPFSDENELNQASEPYRQHWLKLIRSMTHIESFDDAGAAYFAAAFDDPLLMASRLQHTFEDDERARQLINSLLKQATRTLYLKRADHEAPVISDDILQQATRDLFAKTDIAHPTDDQIQVQRESIRKKMQQAQNQFESNRDLAIENYLDQSEDQNDAAIIDYITDTMTVVYANWGQTITNNPDMLYKEMGAVYMQTLINEPLQLAARIAENDMPPANHMSAQEWVYSVISHASLMENQRELALPKHASWRDKIKIRWHRTPQEQVPRAEKTLYKPSGDSAEAFEASLDEIEARIKHLKSLQPERDAGVHLGEDFPDKDTDYPDRDGR